MDDLTRRELETLRAECIAMCDKSRELAEHAIAAIDAQITGDERGAHRKPRQRPSWLTVVKGFVTGAAAYAVVKRFAAVASASAVTAATVTALTVPLVLRSPVVVPLPSRPVPAQSALQHRGRRRPALVRPRVGVPVAPSVAVASSAPVPSPSPSPSSSPLVSVSPPQCLVRLLGLCIP